MPAPPGFALFLAQLAQATGDGRYRRTAEAALDTLRRELPTAGERIPYIGSFNGWGSTIYTLAYLGRLWNSSTLLDEAQAWSGHLAGRIAADRCFDVMGGAAGAIAALLELDRQRPDPALRSLAQRCGDHLIDHATTLGDGVGWQLNAETPPLAGFSHGAAGIAWALARLGRRSGDERYLATAQAALRYENSLFAAGNWRDLRGGSPEQGHKWAWCHGAPGVGLGRAAMLPYLDTPAIRADLAAALESTRRHGFGGNHSLCHGDLGNLELFMTAAQVLGDRDLQAESERLAAGIVASIDRHGALCGTPQGAETLGLMTGLAGIGYMLLRVANPEAVPAVLTLATPGSPG
jgi:type 2 lantibiotic biosynthesis protein LanM